MRVLTPVIAATVLAIAGSAAAAPATVSVALKPELQTKFEKTYGVREAEFLTRDLQTTVEKSLARKGIYEGGRVELTLVDVKPNRPTFKQLSDTPGLSLQSFGIGGAELSGRVITADGAETPISFRWYETDIRQAYGNSVWSDAEWTFDRFARRLANGEQLARR